MKSAQQAKKVHNKTRKVHNKKTLKIVRKWKLLKTIKRQFHIPADPTDYKI